ncbi:MAG TPA: RsmE family RNA methyltransferase [Polyangiaceae bacterium]|nr:RsmE family RNA methyltransferase [Polyangiaceae bacterium]
MAARVRAPIPDLREGTSSAREATAHYLTRVLRLGVGDAFVAFDPQSAREADATIVGIGGEVTLDIGPLRPARVIAPRALTFVQGLAKGDKCDAVVRDATELGATRVIIADCARSVVQLQGPKRQARLERWVRIAHEAARQCGRADPPHIELLSWREAMAQIEPSAQRFCLHVPSPGGPQAPLGPLLLSALSTPAPLPDHEMPIAFAAGPEGGLTDDEVALAESAGWRIATVGNLILRTETAAAAVLGAVRIFEGATFREK